MSNVSPAVLALWLIASSPTSANPRLTLGMTFAQLRAEFGSRLATNGGGKFTLAGHYREDAIAYDDAELTLDRTARVAQLRLSASGQNKCDAIERRLRSRLGKPTESDLTGDTGVYRWRRRSPPIAVEYRDLWSGDARKGSIFYTCWVTQTDKN